jgi:hypothetical protein
MPSIKIISTPPGEPPLEIREAWVGLVLPLDEPKAETRFSFGVLSHPGGLLSQWWAILTGRADKNNYYCVNPKTAIHILES